MVAPRARVEWRVWRERCSRWKGDDDGFGSKGVLQGEEKELENTGLGSSLRDACGRTWWSVLSWSDVEQKLEVSVIQKFKLRLLGVFAKRTWRTNPTTVMTHWNPNDSDRERVPGIPERP
jgi:hypothetical protein